MDEEIKKIWELYWLKDIYRSCRIWNRKESVAEHCWSAMLLVEYFIWKISKKVDKKRVFELLIYHDVIEIETWDVPIHELENHKSKRDKELASMKKLLEKFPNNIKDSYLSLHEEYEMNETIESKFAHAIDKLDPLIHCLYDKDMFHKYEYTEEIIRNNKQKHMEEFPEILDIYEQILKYMRENWYFLNSNM